MATIVTPVEAKRRRDRKLGFPEETYRLNVQLTRDELSMLRLSAELYAEGNVSRLVRHLILGTLPAAHAARFNRETAPVMLTVSAIPPKGRAPELALVAAQ